MGATQYGRSMVVGDLVDGSARLLDRIRFQKGDDGHFNERWLQRLVSRYPNVLPVEQIEPALTPVISVCMELPVSSGYVDNLYVTPAGDLVIGETKLFRNPEARREVVGQILDYAKDLSRLSYAQLCSAVALANAPDGMGGHPTLGLYEAAAQEYGGALTEQDFIDAVSRNLRRGRFLLLIVGDGIQSGVESLVEFLQQHAGMHFTLGLVELAVFRMPTETDGYLVQPRVLMKTQNIERAIVTFEDDRVAVTASPATKPGSNPVVVRTSISAERFYEELAVAYPQMGPRLKAFMQRLEGLGISTEFGKGSIILRWRPDESKAWNLGSITTSGKVWTDLLNTQTNAVGCLELSHAYLQRLADLIPGAYVKQPSKPTSRYVAKADTYVTIDALLAHEDGWIEAIEEFMEAATKALKGQA